MVAARVAWPGWTARPRRPQTRLLRFLARPMPVRKALLLLIAALSAAAGLAAEPADRTFARKLLADLVEIDTGPSGGPGRTESAARLIADRLLAGGLPAEDVRVFVMDDGVASLVARLRAPKPERPPILLVGHLDVVEALAEDWTVPPFRFTEKEGYYYGRGVWDNKAGVTLLVAALLRMRAEGFEPDRDLTLVFTGDEEEKQLAIRWLLREHRDLLDAAFSLNTDGGRVLLREGRPEAVMIETSEKIYVTYALIARNPGGHSSLPRPDNAIYDLAAALERLRAYQFPIDLNESTRAFLRDRPLAVDDPERPLSEALAAGRLEDPVLARLAEFDFLNAQVRTTCVATQLAAGHAENALPTQARAVVNCRVLPQASTDAVETKLRELAAPSGVGVEVIYPAVPGPPSPVDAELFAAIRELSAEFWPGAVVLPLMSAGTTDGLFVRNAGIPSYTIDFLAEEAGGDRSHGNDERIPIASFHAALEVWYRLLQRLAGGA